MIIILFTRQTIWMKTCLSNKHYIDIIYDIADLTFLTLVISRKSCDIADFFHFQRLFETNVVNVMSEGERNPQRRPGSPLGWPKRRMKRPAANEVNEMSGENVSAKWKNISDITKDFRDITKLKKLTSAILDDMHF